MVAVGSIRLPVGLLAGNSVNHWVPGKNLREGEIAINGRKACAV